jgi:hypothetical protein
MKKQEFESLINKACELLQNWGIEVEEIKFNPSDVSVSVITIDTQQEEDEEGSGRHTVEMWVERTPLLEFPMIHFSFDKKKGVPLPAIPEILVAAIHHQVLGIIFS